MCDAGLYQPFRAFPRKLPSLPCDDDCRSRDVFGLAKVGDLIYVVRRHMPKISIYRTSSPYEHVRDIELESSSLLTCLIASESGKYLFLADKMERCVWSVEACHYDKHQTKKMTHSIKKLISLRGKITVQSLSVVPGDESLAVLISNETDLGDSWKNAVQLYKFNNDESVTGKKRVTTPDNAWCICCTKETIVIGYGNENQPSEYSGVQEMDYNGGVLRRYKGFIPQSIHRDGESGTLYVADPRNRKILMLNAKFELKRVLLEWSDADKQPVSICNDRITSKLFVGFSCGEVDVYKICG